MADIPIKDEVVEESLLVSLLVPHLYVAELQARPFLWVLVTLKLCQQGRLTTISIPKHQQAAGGKGSVLVGCHFFEKVCPEVGVFPLPLGARCWEEL